jgi:hypothetical protein
LAARRVPKFVPRSATAIRQQLFENDLTTFLMVTRGQFVDDHPRIRRDI